MSTPLLPKSNLLVCRCGEVIGEITEYGLLIERFPIISTVVIRCPSPLCRREITFRKVPDDKKPLTLASALC